MNDKEKQFIDEVKNSEPVSWIKNFFGMIKGRTLIYITLGLIIGVVIYYFIYIKNPSINRETQMKNEILEKKIDSLINNNALLDYKFVEQEAIIKNLENKLKVNNNLIQKNNAELDKLKGFYNEKITSVDNFNIYNIDTFFTNRYPTNR